MIVRCFIHSRGGYASQVLKGVALRCTCREDMTVGPEESEILLQRRTRHGADKMNLWGQHKAAAPTVG